MYDSAEKQGVKRKSIPSPEDVELPFTTTYNDVLEKGRSLFFEDDDIPLGQLVIADSNGCEIDPGNYEEWTIGDFYSENENKPSRFKLYVMYHPKKLKVKDTYLF